MFRRLLVANRGEIARRILVAGRRLGIETVQVYSEADREAPWLEDADHTVCIGPAAAAHSYLDQDAVLQAAQQYDCQALHPGYGFLSENATFAARCELAGVRFVGPPAALIRRMGDKAAAKAAAAGAGLPTIPGSPGVVSDAGEAATVAEQIGLPVLLKAVAGGGGRGMRRCREKKEIAGAYAEATQEAMKSFGNASIYVEKFIEGGRHVEFQVLGDPSGRVVHLGERECSIQRQHQKLLEESPSPVVDAATRAELGDRVARAMERLGYRNAGTVEFLRSRAGDYYFMEMNTRLQVEHPVTEMLTGVDLVEQQLRIAANQPLRLSQEGIVLNGHAVELRINAEDPDRGFRPDPGLIRRFKSPPARIGEATVRWDSAIRAGYRVPAHYDSMIGKLIVHAADRGSALAAALAALESMEIEGIHTTIPLHRRLLQDEAFLAGDYDVHHLERHGLVQGKGAGR